jgi:HPt (histidine-containing phosphotransfer) domain-containing protein
MSTAIIAIVGLVVLGAVAFFVLKGKKTPKPTQTTPPKPEPKPTPQPAPQPKKELPEVLKVLEKTEAEIKQLIQEQIKQAAASLGIDEAMMKELYENELLAQLEASKQDLFDALANSDYEKLEKVSHSLKGAAQNLGVKVVGDILQEIVNKTRAGEPIEEIRIYVEAVYELLPKMRV